MDQGHAAKRGPLYAASAFTASIVIVSLICYNHKQKLIRRDTACAASELLRNGVFVGNIPFQLDPLELLQQAADGPGAWPAANPVTLAQTTHTQVGVDEPHLFVWNDRIFAFYKHSSCDWNSGHIAVAESNNTGTSWANLKMTTPVLAKSAPYLVYDREQVFMVVQSPGGAELSLHRALQLPTTWEYVKPLLLTTAKPKAIWENNGTWWMIGSHSNAEEVLAGKAGGISEEVFHAPSLYGPWQQHSLHSVPAKMFGRITVHDEKLLRFGTQCQNGECKGISAFEVTVDGAGYKQQLLSQVHITHGGQAAAWDGAGHTHLDAIRLTSGKWLAVATGARLQHAAPAVGSKLKGWQQTLHVLCFFLAIYFALHRMPSAANWMKQLRRQRLHWHSSKQEPDVCLEPSAPVLNAPLAHISIRCQDGSLQKRKGQAASEQEIPTAFLVKRSRKESKPSSWRTATNLPVLIICLALVTVSVDTACFALSPFWQPALPLPVHDTLAPYSKFTLMVMSYDKRLESLKFYISHYSQCPSVGEILVVWNKGEPPSVVELQAAVPVRLRVETLNSMNNRYKPDRELKFRGVLSLDDDIMMPCADVEFAFALWRKQPETIVGFYPRLITQDTEGQLRYNWEDITVKEGKYNALLTGAAFLDSRTAFQSYWSDTLAPARSLVDELVNCDDLLMNFVVANHSLTTLNGLSSLSSPDQPASKGPMPPIEFVRPKRRVDISFLSGVGLSHDTSKFHRQAEQCLKEFVAIFGSNPLQTREFDWSGREAPYCSFTSRAFGCVYA